MAHRDTAMASHLAREGSYTFGEFLELIRDGEKADLLDGAIYMASRTIPTRPTS